MHKVTKEEYQQARDLIATPGKWCREEFGNFDHRVWDWENVIHDPAAQFCALGAIFAVCRTDGNISERALDRASNDLFGVSAIELNDEEGLDAVLQAYDHLLANWDYYNEAK